MAKIVTNSDGYEICIAVNGRSSVLSEPQFLRGTSRHIKGWDIFEHRGKFWFVENGDHGYVHVATRRGRIHPIVYDFNPVTGSITRGGYQNWDRHTLRSNTPSFHKGNVERMGLLTYGQALLFIKKDYGLYRPTYPTCSGTDAMNRELHGYEDRRHPSILKSRKGTHCG